jgi:hypothetical protein
VIMWRSPLLLVMAGLDPAIHHSSQKTLSQRR